MRGPPVVLTDTLGRPVTNVMSKRGAVPMVVVNTLGEPVTLVDSGGEPVTLFNADGTLWSAETDLERIIALSPSLLIWPEQGAGWQGTSGGTLAASGQPLGLGADLSQLGGKTLDEWLAAPTTPEIISNGGFASSADWTAFGDTTSISGGVATLTRVSANTGLYNPGQTFTSGKIYRVTGRWAVTSGSGLARITLRTVIGGAGSTRFSEGLAAPSSLTAFDFIFYCTATETLYPTIEVQVTAATVQFDDISVRELPGNHLRAGTWASPSDAARGTFQNNAINFGGVDDYMSLLNAISITENMTVVRAFKRASAGILSLGLNKSAAFEPVELNWAGDNKVYTGLGGSSSANPNTANTTTGNIVSSVIRNASNEIVRLNGTQTGSVSARAVSGTLDRLGVSAALGFGVGEISFLALFPSELTGADLALVEQIAAATNGSVLA